MTFLPRGREFSWYGALHAKVRSACTASFHACNAHVSSTILINLFIFHVIIKLQKLECRMDAQAFLI